MKGKGVGKRYASLKGTGGKKNGEEAEEEKEGLDRSPEALW